MRRTVLGALSGALAVLAGLAFLLAGASAASADGTPPAPGAGDPFGGTHVPSGPAYVVTPGVGGSALPTPTDQHHVAVQVRKDRAAAHRSPAPKPTTPAKDSVSPVVATPITTASVQPERPESRWWLVGSGAVLVLVLSEFVRLRFRRAVPVR